MSKMITLTQNPHKIWYLVYLLSWYMYQSIGCLTQINDYIKKIELIFILVIKCWSVKYIMYFRIPILVLLKTDNYSMWYINRTWQYNKLCIFIKFCGPVNALYSYNCPIYTIQVGSMRLLLTSRGETALYLHKSCLH